MPRREPRSVKPPASAIACCTLMPGRSTNEPGVLT